MSVTRLNKFLAERLGVSRRRADELIAGGKVQLNDTVAKIGDRVAESDTVCCQGKLVAHELGMTYLLLHKPVGYVSSCRKQGTTPTLYELLPAQYQKLKTVGRLDKDSSGLILLTNDGDFAFRMTHPKFHKMKIYQVRLDLPLEPLHQQMIGDFGVKLADGWSKLGLVKLDCGRKFWQVEMSEGRNRQIRRTFAALGYTVQQLHRVVFGAYQLGELAAGEFKLVEKK